MPAPIPTLADGQVAAATTAVLAAGTPGPVTLTFANTGSLDETLTVTVTRGTGTARRLVKIVLSTDEQLFIANLPLNAADTIKAETTTALTVDYLVVAAPDAAPLTITTLDANGAIKSGGAAAAGPALEQLLSIFGD